jgi:hypothetical protein
MRRSGAEGRRGGIERYIPLPNTVLALSNCIQPRLNNPSVWCFCLAAKVLSSGPQL